MSEKMIAPSPAPWFLRNRDEFPDAPEAWVLEGADGRWIATFPRLTPEATPRQIVDATLARAAPALYEALESAPVMSKYHGLHGFEVDRFIVDYDAWMERRRAALRLARGESSNG